MISETIKVLVNQDQSQESLTSVKQPTPEQQQKSGDIYLSGYDDDDSYEGVYSSIELVTGNGIVKDAQVS